jgi:hypothetical protein
MFVVDLLHRAEEANSDGRRSVIKVFIIDFLRRAEEHDQSKLESPEVEMFTEYTPKLATSTYGSEEYEGFP